VAAYFVALAEEERLYSAPFILLAQHGGAQLPRLAAIQRTPKQADCLAARGVDLVRLFSTRLELRTGGELLMAAKLLPHC
jgi:hypothetical protein